MTQPCPRSQVHQLQVMRHTKYSRSTRRRPDHSPNPLWPGWDSTGRSMLSRIVYQSTQNFPRTPLLVGVPASRMGWAVREKNPQVMHVSDCAGVQAKLFELAGATNEMTQGKCRLTQKIPALRSGTISFTFENVYVPYRRRFGGSRSSKITGGSRSTPETWASTACW